MSVDGRVATFVWVSPSLDTPEPRGREGSEGKEREVEGEMG